MKLVVAFLLLLFQLQPVLGSVACLGLSEGGSGRECAMPEHGRSTTPAVSAAAPATQSCQLAVICAPSPPAVPGASSRFDTSVPLHGNVATLGTSLPLGISPVPPFHPPRV